MSETKTTMITLNDDKSCNLIRFPSGRWGFVGDVPAELAYVNQKGETPTERQFEIARSHGPRLSGLKSLSWATRKEAIAALLRLKEKDKRRSQ